MKPFRILFLAACLLAPALARDFVHPGGLHTRADLDRMAAKVKAGAAPYTAGFAKLTGNRHSQSAWVPNPLTTPARGGSYVQNYGALYNDIHAAYQNALRWKISGDTAHGDAARDILNAWSGTLTNLTGGSDVALAWGIYGYQWANAAEIMRGYTGFDIDRFKNMLLTQFYKGNDYFLTKHNGTCIQHYWANWDLCNMASMLAIGIFCDDKPKFDRAIDYFKHGAGNGSIGHAVPFVYPGGLGQWQESGRDQAHVMGGMGLLAEMCQVAWNQGLDLFGHDNNRLLAGGEYTAQYTLWKGVPYTYYTNSSNANQGYISPNYKGRLAASHFELMYNHYVVRKGLEAPHVQLFAGLRRPEPGEVDVFGYGTLTYTLDPAASPLATAPPPVPREVRATPGIGRIVLEWSPSGAYTAHGYEVSRATSGDGPWQSIYSTNNWTTPAYTDTDVEPGRTYHYTVAALNNAGKSEPSARVSAASSRTAPLPPAFQPATVAGTTFSEAAGRSFIVPATGSGLDGSFAGMPVEGDFDLTAWLVEWRGPVGFMGIVVRQEGDKSPLAVAMTLGEIGSRQARFRARDEKGKANAKHGNDYTWLPVWFRIQRHGDDFTAWQSPDGIEWFEVGKHTVKLSRTALAGLLASTGGNPPGTKKEDAPQALFDHVTIERKLPAPPPAPRALKATKAAHDLVRLDWSTATGPTPPPHAGIKVEASLEGAPFYEIADLPATATRFENTGLQNPAALRYRIRAYHRGGYSPYSNVAP